MDFKIVYLTRLALFFVLSVFIAQSASAAQKHWNGLVVEPENRCSSYDKKNQYPYPQSVEDEIVELMGGRVYGPYSGRYFLSDRDTDIEHIVAASEGHDSGLCAASAQKRKAFATDQLNLTLASPEVNRCGPNGKCGYDAAEWMPDKNKCWYANRIIQIKAKYDLTIDQSEVDALDAVLNNCESVEMIFFPKEAPSDIAKPSLTTKNPLALYDDNKNGRITCSEARSHGIAPVKRKDPAYAFMYDKDGDGMVCE